MNFIRSAVIILIGSCFCSTLALAETKVISAENINLDATKGISICSGTGDIRIATDCTGGGSQNTWVFDNATGVFTGSTTSTANTVLGRTNLVTAYTVPRNSTTLGTLEDTKFLIDSPNNRIYFDDQVSPVDTYIVADTGKCVYLGGNNDFTSYFRVCNNNGDIIWNAYSSGLTGSVGGGAFVRANDVTTIGYGWQTAEAATWDHDLIGSEIGVGSGYDLSLHNKNIAANYRMSAGLDIIFGQGVGVSVPEIARITSTGLSFAVTGKTIAIDSGTAASACKGTGTFNGTTAVTVSTTCSATAMQVNLQRTSAPSGTATCWYDTIVNGTSFNVDCNGAETGTFSWTITKEG